jgi:hypothetical protein
MLCAHIPNGSVCEVQSASLIATTPQTPASRRSCTRISQSCNDSTRVLSDLVGSLGALQSVFPTRNVPFCFGLFTPVAHACAQSTHSRGVHVPTFNA